MVPTTIGEETYHALAKDEARIIAPQRTKEINARITVENGHGIASKRTPLKGGEREFFFFWKNFVE